MKPRITKEEFKKVRSSLFSEGFSTDQINYVEALFIGDLEELGDNHKGIDIEEASTHVSWLRENPSKHKLSRERVEKLEHVLSKHLSL